MAAAIVATPMVMTMATRIPDNITGKASGSSTFHNNWLDVRPMATAASRTGALMPAMPT